MQPRAATPVLTPSTRPSIDTRPADPDLSDANEVAHIAPADKVTEAYIMGIPIEALCGARFVPSKDPKDKPLCQACKEIYDAFVIPLRNDDSIKDDI
jgi:hypothetical protein